MTQVPPLGCVVCATTHPRFDLPLAPACPCACHASALSARLSEGSADALAVRAGAHVRGDSVEHAPESAEWGTALGRSCLPSSDGAPAPFSDEDRERRAREWVRVCAGGLRPCGEGCLPLHGYHVLNCERAQVFDRPWSCVCGRDFAVRSDREDHEMDCDAWVFGLAR